LHAVLGELNFRSIVEEMGEVFIAALFLPGCGKSLYVNDYNALTPVHRTNRADVQQ
jgi:hypothetical protein